VPVARHAFTIWLATTLLMRADFEPHTLKQEWGKCRIWHQGHVHRQRVSETHCDAPWALADGSFAVGAGASNKQQGEEPQVRPTPRLSCLQLEVSGADRRHHPQLENGWPLPLDARSPPAS